jgi:nicotine blue oxidoreductase
MTDTAELERVVVVLGAHADLVRSSVDFGRAEPVVCADWSEGIAASLRCAVQALPHADPLLVALGDQPGLTSTAVAAVTGAALAHPHAPGVRATYQGAPGHPVAIRASLRERVLLLRGDAGAGRLLMEGGALSVECAALATGADVDTAEQLEALRAQ